MVFKDDKRRESNGTKEKEKQKRERDGKEECEFSVAILLQTKSAVLFSVVVEPREFARQRM